MYVLCKRDLRLYLISSAFKNINEISAPDCRLEESKTISIRVLNIFDNQTDGYTLTHVCIIVCESTIENDVLIIAIKILNISAIAF